MTHASLYTHVYISLYTDNDNCNLHQINGGAEEANVVGDTATVLFEGTGPIITNVVTEYDTRIQLREDDGSITTLGNRIFLCPTTIPVVIPDANNNVLIVDCGVDTGTLLCTIT